jgi:chemotaxis-related protein WspB
MELKQLPQAPHGVAGVFNHGGAPVPVIDLCLWALGRPARSRLSTRLILVHYFDGGGAQHLLGLIAEKATGTVQRAPSDFIASGVAARETPYLGPVAADARGLIQRIEINQLLSDTVRDALFQTPPSSWSDTGNSNLEPPSSHAPSLV